MRVYLSCPMMGYRWRVAARRASYIRGRLERLGCSVYSPVEIEAENQDPDAVIGTARDRHALSAPSAFFYIDKGEVLRADAVFADLAHVRSGSSIGCDFELAWAHLSNKLIVTVLKEGSTYDRHPFMHACGAAVFYDIDEALSWLERYLASLDDAEEDRPDDGDPEGGRDAIR